MRRSTFTYFTEAGGRTQRKHRFEGIIPNLERRYKENRVAAVPKNCPSTSRAAVPGMPRRAPEQGGSQRVRGRPPAAGPGGAAIDRGAEVLQRTEPPGWRGEIAAKIVKEIGERLGFLVDVGLGLPDPGAQGRHPVRW